MVAFKDHFSAVAADYATFRPTYPPALTDFLAAIAPGRGLALDCGCGTGQLSRLLADRFDRVVATDASAEQIAAAAPHPNVDFRVAPAEHSGLADASADLITAAQAAHWFDLEAFYPEVRRVGRSGAAVALIAYGNPAIAGAAGAVVTDFYTRVLDGYWPPERRHIEAGYATFAFPFDEIAAPAIPMRCVWPRDRLAGYIETWSAVRAIEAAAGRAPFEAFRARLAEAWGDPETPRMVEWPLSIRAGHLPPG